MKMHVFDQMKDSKKKILENHEWFESLRNFSYCDEMRGTIYEHK